MWCGYAVKLFMDEIGQKSYFAESETRPENCLFAKFHTPQTERMKCEIMKQLTGKNDDRIICVVFATIAIGIGVNITSLRHVVHIGAPRTIESYYQEIGRAGRDGNPANASLFFNGHDIAINKPGMTEAMTAFCMEETCCLREELMVYLGSPSTEIHCKKHPCCSNCSKCCQCISCTTNIEFSQISCDAVGDIEEPTCVLVCDVSDVKQAKIKEMMIKYRRMV